MGGLKVTPHQPAPRYDFEMLHAKDQSLFLHFKVPKDISSAHKCDGLLVAYLGIAALGDRFSDIAGGTAALWNRFL